MRTRTLGALLAAALIAPAALAAQHPTGRNAVPQTHTVAKGETLWSVAQQLLGDGHRWREIYDLNKGQIPDPHWIHPGQVLQLPGAVTSVAVTMTPPAGPPPRDTVAKAGAPGPMVRAAAPTPEPAGNPMVGSTVFQREAQAPTAGVSKRETAPPLPTVLPGEYLAAPFVVASSAIPGAGRVVGSGALDPQGQYDTRVILKAYDDALVEPPTGAAGRKGERYVALRAGPSLHGIGQVMIPMGIVQVTHDRTGADAVRTQVVSLFGEMHPGDMLVPLDSAAPSSTDRPSPVSDGRWTAVEWVMSEPVLPTVDSYIVLGLTAADGVKPGDEFVMFKAPREGASSAEVSRPEIPIGRAKAVRVTAFGTTAIVTAQVQPAINAGVLARVSAKMP